MKNTPKPLQLKFDSATVSYKKFRRGIEAFFGLIDEISRDMFSGEEPISWSVKVRSGSNVIEAVAEPAKAQQAESVSKQVMSGLKLIEGKGIQPDHFSLSAMRKLKSLAGLHEPGRGVSMVYGEDKKELSAAIEKKISFALRTTHSAVGTLEGRLAILAKRNRLEVEIREEVSGQLVHCYIPEDLLEDAKESFDRRVSVSGLIHYTAEGTPKSIEVHELFRFPLPRELPSHDDVRGILAGAN